MRLQENLTALVIFTIKSQRGQTATQMDIWTNKTPGAHADY